MAPGLRTMLVRAANSLRKPVRLGLGLGLGFGLGSGCDLSVEAWRREGKVGLDLGLG